MQAEGLAATQPRPLTHALTRRVPSLPALIPGAYPRFVHRAVALSKTGPPHPATLQLHRAGEKNLGSVA
ncbi:protein of unknown function [Pararobbsia alpina]